MDNIGKFAAIKPFRDLWNSLLNPQKSGSGLEERVLRFSALGLLPAIAIFLALVIALVSYLIHQRSSAGMSTLLAEKGNSLINVFESALRTGLEDGSLNLATFLKEMAKGQDIEFVALTMPDGTIISHSQAGRLGEKLTIGDGELEPADMAKLAPTGREKWVMANVEGKDVFLVYRNFDLGTKDWDKNVPKPILFLGLETSPFEITSGQNRSYITMLAIVTMLVVLCGLLALSFAQRAADSKKLQRHAEGEVHRLEEEMRRQEKLAAVGTLAAGVAHEIRNPLSSIKGYATYFKQRFAEGSEDRQAAAVMVNEVDRLNRVITDLLGLSRPDDVKPKPVRLDYLIEHIKRLVRHQAGQNNVKVVSRIARNVPPIEGDPERISQAVLNLCLNAIQAMPEGGTLTIALSGGKQRVCIAIMDTGTGIDPEHINRIFDPYFTTRGTGTGLGLPMVHKIVSSHHGNITVSTRKATVMEPGWTLFRIWLPVLFAEKDIQSKRESARKG